MYLARRKIDDLDSAYKDIENTELLVKQDLSRLSNVEKTSIAASEKQFLEAEDDAHVSYRRIRRKLEDTYNALIV